MLLRRQNIPDAKYLRWRSQNRVDAVIDAINAKFEVDEVVTKTQCGGYVEHRKVEVHISDLDVV